MCIPISHCNDQHDPTLETTKHCSLGWFSHLATPLKIWSCFQMETDLQSQNIVIEVQV